MAERRSLPPQLPATTRERCWKKLGHERSLAAHIVKHNPHPLKHFEIFESRTVWFSMLRVLIFLLRHRDLSSIR
jgi:hypothetical protein